MKKRSWIVNTLKKLENKKTSVTERELNDNSNKSNILQNLPNHTEIYEYIDEYTKADSINKTKLERIIREQLGLGSQWNTTDAINLISIIMDDLRYKRINRISTEEGMTVLEKNSMHSGTRIIYKIKQNSITLTQSKENVSSLYGIYLENNQQKIVKQISMRNSKGIPTEDKERQTIGTKANPNIYSQSHIVEYNEDGDIIQEMVEKAVQDKRNPSIIKYTIQDFVTDEETEGYVLLKNAISRFKEKRFLTPFELYEYKTIKLCEKKDALLDKGINKEQQLSENDR